MGRFLTPSKIALLLVAQIYTEGSVPLSSSNGVLDFLIRSILPDLKRSTHNIDDLGASISISQFEKSLLQHPSMIPGRTVWDLLLKRLWTIDCSNAVDSFIASSATMLTKSREQLLRERDFGEVPEEPAGKIVRTSPLGVFIRRCHIEYTRLQFQDSIAVWQDLIAYRLPTRSAYEKKNGRDEHSILDVNLSDLSIDSTHPLAHILFGKLAEQDRKFSSTFSSHDVERLLEFQVSEMQRIGGRLPEPMRTKLSEMSLAGANLPKMAHYLTFLDSWRAGDFASAFDNLHRYFDYTMQTRDRTFYQYALLNLAILQADFGCHSEAIPAIQEAIATARENKDTICLNFCMSWLYHFGRSFPAEMKGVRQKGILAHEIEGLQFLKSRAKDAEMWTLLSSSLLSEAKLGLQHGDSIATVFENIVKASHINLVKQVPNITGSVLLMKASVFGRIGQNHMASTCCEIFLECHAQDAPLEDLLKCSCRLASLLVQRGRYAEADAIMTNIPPGILRVLKYQNYWAFQATLLKLRRLLHRGDLDTASLLLQRLQGQGAPDVETRSMLGFLAIDYHVRRKDFNSALSRIGELAESIETENNDVMIRTRLLTLKAGLLARAGVPFKGFSMIMRAASLAYNTRLLPALWDAITGLAMILIATQEFTATRSLLEGVLPQVLECQDCSLAARTHSLLADTFVGLAGLEDDLPLKRKEFIGLAMEHIGEAFEQWKFIEDLAGQLDCLGKKARIQYWRGDAIVANDTASQFLEIRKSSLAAHE